MKTDFSESIKQGDANDFWGDIAWGDMEELKQMVARGAKKFWARRGIPEPVDGFNEIDFSKYREKP
jgi:hypothetical protein